MGVETGDLPVNGEKRKIVMQMSRGGFLCVVDRTNGKLVAAPRLEKMNWQFQTSSGINAQPTTHTHNGRQYVSIQVGGGGVNVVRTGAQLANVPSGGSVWTFALIA